MDSCSRLTPAALTQALVPTCSCAIASDSKVSLSWRASQNLYGGSQPYRPVFYSFNAIWAPKLSKNFTAELLAGVGGEDVRFYGLTNCNNFFGCTTYSSSNHFMGDFGGGIRAYIWHDVFVRPEVRLYLINNNNEFSSNTVVRYGASLGYSFGGR